MTKAEWSGWAQAIGAIATIMLAIYISNRDRKHAKNLQEAVEKRLQKRERDIAGALINRFAGTLHAALKSHAEGIAGYLWDVQRTRVLLGAEIELIKNVPISALVADERFILFSLQTVALQLFEAMVSAEKTSSMNGDNHLIIDENSHILLDKVAQAHLDVVEKKLKDLRDAWAKNGNSQMPG